MYRKGEKKMKRIFLLLFVLTFVSGLAFAKTATTTRIDTVVYNTYYNKTLTNAIDTVDVAFSSPERFTSYTIVATSTVTDTLNVYVQSKDGTAWVQRGLVDLSTGTMVSFIYATTISGEYLIVDPQPLKIRIVSTSMDASTTTIILQGKTGIPTQGTNINTIFMDTARILMTASSAVTYSVGDNLGGSFYGLTVVRSNGMGGTITSVELCGDTSNSTGASFDILFVKDSTGFTSGLTDNGAYTTNFDMDKWYVGQDSVQFYKYGTTGGAKGYKQTSISFKCLSNSTKLYALIILRNNYLPKRVATYRLKVHIKRD